MKIEEIVAALALSDPTPQAAKPAKNAGSKVVPILKTAPAPAIQTPALPQPKPQPQLTVEQKIAANKARIAELEAQMVKAKAAPVAVAAPAPKLNGQTAFNPEEQLRINLGRIVNALRMTGTPPEQLVAAVKLHEQRMSITVGSTDLSPDAALAQTARRMIAALRVGQQITVDQIVAQVKQAEAPYVGVVQ